MSLFSTTVGAITDLQTLAANFQGLSARRRTEEREDSAIQRRVADMREAGINPILAAGNPAQSQAIQPTVRDAGATIDALAKKSAIDLQKQQNKVFQAQERKINLEERILTPQAREAGIYAEAIGSISADLTQSGKAYRTVRNNWFLSRENETLRYDLANKYGIPVDMLNGPIGQAVVANQVLSTAPAKDKARLISYMALTQGANLAGRAVPSTSISKRR